MIAGASEALRQARTLLLQPAPQNLDMACSALATAITQVTGLHAALTASPSRDLATPIAGLRKDLDVISRLLEQAASYHVHLMQCMTEAAASDVAPGPAVAHVRRLSLVG